MVVVWVGVIGDEELLQALRIGIFPIVVYECEGCDALGPHEDLSVLLV